MRLINELDLYPLGATGRADSFGQRVKHVSFRIVRKISFFPDKTVNPIGYDRIHCLRQSRRVKVSLRQDLNVNWNFEDHKIKKKLVRFVLSKGTLQGSYETTRRSPCIQG